MTLAMTTETSKPKSTKTRAPRAPRPKKPTKRERAVAALREEFGELIVTLDYLAAIAPEACRCGRVESHLRCSKCGACEPNKGAKTVLSINFQAYVVNGCGSCDAKASRFSAPIYTWHPRPRFATSFAVELREKMLVRGWRPSDKQVALANRLATEDHTRIPTSMERPALACVTSRSPAWDAILKLLERDAFSLTKESKTLLKEVSNLGEHADRASRAAAKEILALVRGAAKRILEDRTGYDVLATEADYNDALKGASGDKVLYDTIVSLMETHAWLVREKRIVVAT